VVPPKRDRSVYVGRGTVLAQSGSSLRYAETLYNVPGRLTRRSPSDASAQYRCAAAFGYHRKNRAAQSDSIAIGARTPLRSFGCWFIYAGCGGNWCAFERGLMGAFLAGAMAAARARARQSHDLVLDRSRRIFGRCSPLWSSSHHPHQASIARGPSPQERHSRVSLRWLHTRESSLNHCVTEKELNELRHHGR
jgi:hypothetical protein